jgi:hypothetical protein
MTCGGPHPSEVLLVDEIGRPIASASVKLTLGGVVSTVSTNADGKICFSSPPGTSIIVELASMHEAASGDSTKTPSGQHFKASGTGP